MTNQDFIGKLSFMNNNPKIAFIIASEYLNQYSLSIMSKLASTISKKVRLGRPGTSLKMGLLGMANIGKSSTFNLLTNLNVPVQNRPFCTIEPNSAFISIKDFRFEKLVELYRPQKVTPPVLRILDIAGLVKGASQGFGLGNEFLSHVMQVDGLYHLVRAFGGQQIAHTQGQMDAVRDVNIIRHELLQKDIEIIQKRNRQFGRKAAKSQDKTIREQYDVMLKAQQALKKGIQVRHLSWTEREAQFLNKYLLLTSKPMVYLINLSKQNYLSSKIENQDKLRSTITYDGKFPAKIIPFSVEYQQSDLNKDKSQIDSIIKAGYEELQLCHFYTVGTDEVRAWAIRTGETAIQAGGKIHSDFTKGFINAEVIHADMLINNPSLKQKLAKSSKKQGKGYFVKQGDILHFNCKIK